MNSVVNGKVLENTPFESVYISHSPDDLGNSIGAAMYVYHAILRNPRNHRRLVSNLGPSFSSEAIDKVLSRRRINLILFCILLKLLLKYCPREVVAVLQGQMEFGDRALGFRSILGDPRSSDMKDKINGMIKYRKVIDHSHLRHYLRTQMRFAKLKKVIPVITWKKWCKSKKNIEIS